LGILEALIPSVQKSFETEDAGLEAGGKYLGIEAERTARDLARPKEECVLFHPLGDAHPVNWIWAQAGTRESWFIVLAGAIFKQAPQVRVVAALDFPLARRDVERAVAYVFDGVVNDDRVADVVSPMIRSDFELDIAVVDEWLLPAYVPRDNGEEDEERSAR
jgi:hypothetical protein